MDIKHMDIFYHIIGKLEIIGPFYSHNIHMPNLKIYPSPKNPHEYKYVPKLYLKKFNHALK